MEECMQRSRLFVLALGIGLGLPAAAQQPAAPAAGACPPGYNCTAVPSPGAALGLYTFPAKGQTKEVQLEDEKACYGWAKEQSGIDPAAVTANPDSAAKAAKAKTENAATGAAVAGSAKGAAGGALIGAAAGDAGKGAAIGATAGAVAGRRAKKQAGAQAAQQGAKAEVAGAQAEIATFKKAMTACLEGKGYTVK